MLRFEPVPFQDDADARYGAVIVTSANALRAIAPHLAGSRLLLLPLFAVGEHTAATAREAGFGEVIASKGDAGALRDLVLATAKSKQLKKASPLVLRC
jgi:uroporphyrinogen-III synthase